MERPRPKLVKVVPRGTMASNRARSTESVPGSQPAAVMLTLLPALAAASRRATVAGISVWMSKLSTQL